jgi:hypothetical protein
LPSWTPGGILALGACDPQAGPTPTGLMSVLLRRAALPLKWGALVALTLVVVETLLLYPLKRIAPENTKPFHSASEMTVLRAATPDSRSAAR